MAFTRAVGGEVITSSPAGSRALVAPVGEWTLHLRERTAVRRTGIRGWVPGRSRAHSALKPVVALLGLIETWTEPEFDTDSSIEATAKFRSTRETPFRVSQRAAAPPEERGGTVATLETGDRAFDSRFEIETEHRGTVRNLSKSASVRDLVARVLGDDGQFVCERGVIRLTSSGSFTTPGRQLGEIHSLFETLLSELAG
jgi:hypothetical protein